MARPIRTIDVFANPYSGIDNDGRPQGVTQMPGSHNYIGAFVDLEACKATGKTRIYFAPPNEAKGEKGVHGLRKFSVPFTAEIARAVLEGGLIVAEKEHARMAGLSADDFVEPEKQLEAERERALKARRAELGDDATILDVPTEPTPAPDPEAIAKAAKDAAEIAKRVAKRGDGPALTGAPLAGQKGNPSLVLRKSEEA